MENKIIDTVLDLVDKKVLRTVSILEGKLNITLDDSKCTLINPFAKGYELSFEFKDGVKSCNSYCIISLNETLDNLMLISENFSKQIELCKKGE